MKKSELISLVDAVANKPPGFQPIPPEVYNELMTKALALADLQSNEDPEAPNTGDQGMYPPTWHKLTLSNLDNYKSHQTALVIINDNEYLTPHQERIQSLISSLNRHPDTCNGGTIKADVFALKLDDDGWHFSPGWNFQEAYHEVAPSDVKVVLELFRKKYSLVVLAS